MEIKTFDERRKTLVKKIIAACGLVLIFGIAVVLVILSVNKHKEEEYLKTYGMTALTVGENEVTYDIYRCLYLNYRDELEASYTTDGVTDTAALDSDIRARILNDIRYMYAVVSLAGEHGLSTTSSDVIAVADTFIEEMKVFCKDNGMDFDKKLADGYMTEQAFVFFQRVNALADVLFTALVEDGGAIENDDAKVLEFLNGDDFAKIISIFVENDAGEDVEENRRRAAEALEKYKSGTDFATLIGQYCEEVPGGEAYIMRGEREAAFDSAAFALEEGEVSDVVECDDGFYIILRLKKDEAHIADKFEQFKSTYQSLTFENKIKARANSLVATESDYVRALSYEEIR